jgi:hypothetical protein
MELNMSNLSLEEAKKTPKILLNKIINKAKKYIKNDKVMKEAFTKRNLSIDIIDFIPIIFGDLDVSAKTDHGIIILNYKLLVDDFEKNYPYIIHEITHVLQQLFGDEPTKGSNNGDYLSNEYEIEGFQNQIEYIANHEGEKEAEKYVDHLLDYHDIKDTKINNTKETLMAKV